MFSFFRYDVKDKPRATRIFKINLIKYKIHLSTGEQVDCEYEDIAWNEEYTPYKHWILQMLMNLSFHISGDSIFKQDNIVKITLDGIEVSRVESY